MGCGASRRQMQPLSPEALLYYDVTKGLLRGQAHSLAGRLDVALDTLNEVLEHQPQCARAYLERGMVYLKLQQPEPAASDFTMALAHQPQYLPAHIHRAQAYLSLHLYLPAMEDCRAALAIDHDNSQVKLLKQDIIKARQQSKLQQGQQAAAAASAAANAGGLGGGSQGEPSSCGLSHDNGAAVAAAAVVPEASSASMDPFAGFETPLMSPTRQRPGSLGGPAKTCMVCMDAERGTRLRPCLHSVLCEACAHALQARRLPCPICNTRIEYLEVGRFKRTFGLEDIQAIAAIAAEQASKLGASEDIGRPLSGALTGRSGAEEEEEAATERDELDSAAGSAGQSPRPASSRASLGSARASLGSARTSWSPSRTGSSRTAAAAAVAAHAAAAAHAGINSPRPRDSSPGRSTPTLLLGAPPAAAPPAAPPPGSRGREAAARSADSRPLQGPRPAMVHVPRFAESGSLGAALGGITFPYLAQDDTARQTPGGGGQAAVPTAPVVTTSSQGPAAASSQADWSLADWSEGAAIGASRAGVTAAAAAAAAQTTLLPAHDDGPHAAGTQDKAGGAQLPTWMYGAEPGSIAALTDVAEDPEILRALADLGSIMSDASGDIDPALLAQSGHHLSNGSRTSMSMSSGANSVRSSLARLHSARSGASPLGSVSANAFPPQQQQPAATAVR